MLQPAKYVPARLIGTSRRSLTGRVPSADQRSVSFESALERDLLVILAFSQGVRSFREQPYSIQYWHMGEQRRYTPDVLAEWEDRSGAVQTIVYEVKYRDDLRAGWETLRPRFKAALKDCKARGWRFKIITEVEIRTTFLTNARFLRRYIAMPVQAVTRQQLLYTMKALGTTTPQALLAAGYWSDESRMAAIPELWKLIAERVISVDLAEPLTMASTIWLDQ